MAARTPKSARTRRPVQSTTAEFVCPECGRTFSRPQALGAHRRQAHNVKGSSATATRRNAALAKARRRPSTAKAAPTRVQAAAARTRSRTATPRRSPAAASNGASGGANRDALLKALFPNGMPARTDVIEAVNNWLAEAERLARIR
jgi:predicted RNA-binding Zn-ribbon protein involved in translation (DUF1610 family)